MRRRLRARLLLLAVALAGCSKSSADTFTGAVLHQQYHAPETMLTDTDGQPFSLASSTDKRLTLIFFGYTHCPDECPTTMATLASAMLQLDASRPRQRAGRLRDHRPRARHRAGDPDVARPLRLVVRRRHRPAAHDQARRHRRWASRSRRGGACPAAGTTSRTAPRSSRSTGRTPCPSSGPSAPPHPSSPTTSTSCSPEDARVDAVHPQPLRGRLVPRSAAAARLRAVHHRRDHRRDLDR